MKLPELSELSVSRDTADVFGGYNHNLRIGDGEFYDMKNLTSQYYPVLSPRKPRGVYCVTETEPLGMIEKDALCYVTQADGHLYFHMNGHKNDLGATAVKDGTERTLVSMGAYVIVMPDKKYFNTKDSTDKGDIEAAYPPTAGTPESAYTTFTLCRADGESYTIDISSSDEPKGTEENPLKNGFTWLDTSQSPPSLKVYSEKSGLWSAAASTFIKITSYLIDESFSQYDGVTISGVDSGSKALDEALNGKTHVIYACGKAPETEEENGMGWIVVAGITEEPAYTQEGWITVKRQMPETDFIIESNNRLWGCRYGLNSEGRVVNEIYASKLGDFKNWSCFMGISTDSYYASLGTDGQFTGAAAYLGYPTFFKENCMHTVYGSFPAEYQIQDTACRGVQKGSEKSLAMVNEVLYYKSRTGICAYSGSLPAEISAALGEKAYSDAVGCAYKGKYYIAMKDVSDGQSVLFVYDTEKGLWHKEEGMPVRQFCPAYPAELNGGQQTALPRKDEIYYTDGTKRIKTLLGSGTPDEDRVSWMAETGILGISSPDKKYISRLAVRLSMDIGARIVFSVEYDSSGVWEQVSAVNGRTLKSFTLPIRPRRCDHFRLRIEGTGGAKIFSISKITEQGSDV